MGIPVWVAGLGLQGGRGRLAVQVDAQRVGGDDERVDFRCKGSIIKCLGVRVWGFRVGCKVWCVGGASRYR